MRLAAYEGADLPAAVQVRVAPRARAAECQGLGCAAVAGLRQSAARARPGPREGLCPSGHFSTKGRRASGHLKSSQWRRISTTIPNSSRGTAGCGCRSRKAGTGAAGMAGAAGHAPPVRAAAASSISAAAFGWFCRWARGRRASSPRPRPVEVMLARARDDDRRPGLTYRRADLERARPAGRPASTWPSARSPCTTSRTCRAAGVHPRPGPRRGARRPRWNTRS